MSDEGKALFQQTSQLFTQLCQRVDTFSPTDDELSGVIRVGCLSEVGLARGELDAGILSTPLVQENYKSFEVFQEQIILVAHASLAKHKLASFEHIPFVAYRENDPLITMYFKKLMPHQRLAHINIQMLANSHRSMAQLICIHPLYAVLPYLSVAKELESKKIVQIGKLTVASKLFWTQRDTPIVDKRIEALKKHMMS